MTRSACLALAAGSVVLAACAEMSGPVPSNAMATLSVDRETTDDLNSFLRHHHYGGAVMFVAVSLDTLGLAPEQAAGLARIQSSLFRGMEPARLAEQEVLAALADGLAAGAIDTPRVDAAVARVEAASVLVREETAGALNELHRALTPVERNALVDKVEAHWTLFEQADATREGNRHLSDLAHELALSPTQVAAIGARLAETAAADPTLFDSSDTLGRLDGMNAFRKDTFDALLASRAVAPEVCALGVERMARFYEAVGPLLTPDQRARLVVLLRDHATHKESAAVASQGGTL